MKTFKWYDSEERKQADKARRDRKAARPAKRNGWQEKE